MTRDEQDSIKREIDNIIGLVDYHKRTNLSHVPGEDVEARKQLRRIMMRLEVLKARIV